MVRQLALAAITLALGTLPLVAQDHQHTSAMPTQDDSAFTALKQRGGSVMRVDQDKALHHFDALPDGGRIELQATEGNEAAINGIREHFQEIEAAFARGDFAIPMFVHDQAVPGTAVMAARRGEIRYVRRELPRGAELRLLTSDPQALKAIHEFMAFQRGDHRADGVH